MKLLKFILLNYFFYICFVSNAFTTDFNNNKKNNNNSITIKADSLTNKKKKNEILAEGNVKFEKNDYIITSEKIVFDKINKEIFFNGKTKFSDVQKNNIFAEDGKITSDINEGDFNNAGIILNNGISIISPKISKKNNKFFIKKCGFYFCENNNLDTNLPYDEIKKEMSNIAKQPISLYSLESILDKDKEKIYFKNVFIRFFKIPIFYMPYFSTSAGLKNKFSGISSPKILSDTNYGVGLAFPIKIYLSDNIFLNLEETYYFKYNNILSDIKFNYNENNTNLMINYLLAFDNNASKNIKNDNDISEYDEKKYNKTRDFIKFYFSEKKNYNLFYYLDFKFTEDKYFLRDYKNDYDEFLNSNFLFYKGFGNFNHIKLTALKTIMIREEKNKDYLDNPDYVLNLDLFYNKQINKNLIINFDNNTNSIFGEDNNKYDRNSTVLNTNYIFYINNLFLDFNFDVNNDYYKHLIDKNQQPHDSKNRFFGEINLNLNYYANYYDVSITPIVQYYYNNLNNRKNYIDKNGKSSQLTILNVFSGNRYNNYDLLEYGTRINYGVIIDYNNINLTLAQAYKSRLDKNYKIENFENNFSDILTSLGLDFDNFSFNYLNVIDRKNLHFKKQDFIFLYEYKNKIKLNSIYSRNKFHDEYQYFSENKTNEQLILNVEYKINNFLRYNVELENNLEYKKITYFKNTISYEENCLKIEISAKKYNYIDSQNKNGWNFDISLRIN